ncbi:hypothetical protein DFH07DRAFT_801103 [Mycena maculata]|uniref:DUF6699 domain-containing protein n=1 Tax=Mycena maculata TaxID=230809 RepID=A0AAD7JY57_9AGAR|nr:hypothetical protein DFH07DRAFT_801103 [Mycena maculata]
MLPQSPSSVTSPMSYVSGKASHRSPPPPALSSEPARSLGYYPAPGTFAPFIPTVPLPPSPASSSRHSSHTHHSSYSSHTVSHCTSPILHPLLGSGKMTFPISSDRALNPDLITSVPQELQQHKAQDDAFFPVQYCVQIQISDDKAISPLIVRNSRPLSVQMILHALHEHLHASIARSQFPLLKAENQAKALASFDARCAKRSDVHACGIKVLDVLGFGANNIVFLGLRKCEGTVNDWFPVFVSHARRA